MKICDFLRDERGIETRALVFILAAVILVLLISVVTQTMNSAQSMVDTAINQANDTINATLG